jgi:hypothetical protein
MGKYTRGSPLCSIALLPFSLSGQSQQAQNTTANEGYRDQYSSRKKWLGESKRKKGSALER